MMAADFLTYKQALAELRLTAEQLDKVVKAGKLRTFLDAGEKKFRTSDIAAYKRAAESQETLAQPATGSSESKLDLSEIESEPGADIADQTSVLDLEGAEATPARAEEPVFDFSEETAPSESGSKLDLSDIESEPGADVADQTSVLPIGEEGEESPAVVESDEPVFDFSEEEPSDSVLVADESESSADILQVAEEVTEGSSSDLAAVPVEEATKSSSSELSDTDLVADILEGGGEGEPEEALETVGLADLEPIGGGEAIAEETGADELLTQMDTGEELETQVTAETGEDETVGLTRAEAGTAIAGGETLLEEGLEEAAPAAAFGARVPRAAAYAGVLGCAWANVLLGVSSALVLLACFMLLSSYLGPDHFQAAQKIVQLFGM
ncbi:MAG: hypothetical protein ACTSYK_07925 [Alphaproteobacteria bacterium]